MTSQGNTTFQEQNLLMQGIGGGVIHYRSGVDGFLWNIPLVRNTGKIGWIVAYGVNKILDPVGRAHIPEGKKQFPKMPAVIFDELPHKRLDLLIGLCDLNVHPGCSKGFGQCDDCNKNRCCYQSYYGHWWVCIGRLSMLGTEDVSLTSSITRVALCKGPPTPFDLLFSG